ncbi:glycosyl transferase [Synechococcus phage S-CRM01]|uniref:methyltransferase n=1 Tax=Synechococcus phage S-CRM01 TaxID=1026955 RepID=UPI000209E396|nr:methyltransferase [Synechococcus phage S-CRM01]AEC53036.1 glycosyl transferase [Synechococcus phage S-CRM01]
MKFSIITPTHKVTKHLKELYESILKQYHQDWEWVLWLNNGVGRDEVSWARDPRVRVFEDRTNSKKVGYHKHMAFHRGRGDILVEADHDDLLLPHCLTRLAEEFQDSEVGFVGSDNAKLHYADKFIPYDSSFGWQHRKVTIDGKELWAPLTFQPSSHSLCLIWFAPDHVRAWRASVYREIGGHNKEMEVLDDQDLMIRTYLRSKFIQLNEVLYIYRITGDNTWLAKSKDIQKQTVMLRDVWSRRLAERDAELNGKLKVDIGGGMNPRPGYITIDQEDGEITCDLNNGIPLEDNSVGVLNASHVLEHLKDPIKSMREIHRVLHHGGWAFIEVPSTDGRGAWQDPTHVSFWNQNSFWYYTQKQQADFIRNTDIRFMVNRLETHYHGDWWRDNHIPVVTANLIALKDDEDQPRRIPGQILI